MNVRGLEKIQSDGAKKQTLEIVFVRDWRRCYVNLLALTRMCLPFSVDQAI